MRSLDAGETWSDCSAELLALAELPHLKSRIGSDTDAEGMLDAHALGVSAALPGASPKPEAKAAPAAEDAAAAPQAQAAKPGEPAQKQGSPQ